MSSKEILELKSPFGLSQSSPIYTYPFFGEDQLLKLSIPLGTSESILDALEIVVCVNISLSISTKNNNNDIPVPCADYFLGLSDEKTLGKAGETISDKLKELTEASGFVTKCFTNWKEFQELYNETSHIDESKAVECIGNDNNNSSSNCFKMVNSSKNIFELVYDEGNDRENGLYNRLQILLPFFIEAATPINTSNSKWSIYLYLSNDSNVENNDNNKEIVCKGLLNTYSYFRFPEGNRIRISQVMVFPRFQGHQLGSQLYRQVCNKLRDDAECVEICVEDPTDEFEKIRGSCDWMDADELGLWKCSDELKSKLMKTLKLTEEHSMRLMNLNQNLNLNQSKEHQNQKNKKVKLQDNPIEIELRKQIKRWLLKKYKKELPEELGKERISKLSELYEVEMDEFIEPIIKFLNTRVND